MNQSPILVGRSEEGVQDPCLEKTLFGKTRAVGAGTHFRETVVWGGRGSWTHFRKTCIFGCVGPFSGCPGSLGAMLEALQKNYKVLPGCWQGPASPTMTAGKDRGGLASSMPPGSLGGMLEALKNNSKVPPGCPGPLRVMLEAL